MATFTPTIDAKTRTFLHNMLLAPTAVTPATAAAIATKVADPPGTPPAITLPSGAAKAAPPGNAYGLIKAKHSVPGHAAAGAGVGAAVGFAVGGPMGAAVGAGAGGVVGGIVAKVREAL